MQRRRWSVYSDDTVQFQTAQVFNGSAIISRAIGKSKNTVIKYVNMLEEKGLITNHKTFVVTKDGKAWNGNLMFGIAPIRDAWDVYYYHQMWDRNGIPYIKQKKRKRCR